MCSMSLSIIPPVRMTWCTHAVKQNVRRTYKSILFRATWKLKAIFGHAKCNILTESRDVKFLLAQLADSSTHTLTLEHLSCHYCESSRAYTGNFKCWLAPSALHKKKSHNIIPGSINNHLTTPKITLCQLPSLATLNLYKCHSLSGSSHRTYHKPKGGGICHNQFGNHAQLRESKTRM